MTISIEEKQRVTEFNKLFKMAPAQITEEIRKDLKSINEKAWNIAKEKTLSIEERQNAHDIIKLIHEILGMKYDDNWRPKATAGGIKNAGWTATTEQRTKNCNDFVNYIGKTVWNSLTPYEMTTVLARIWGTTKQ